MANQSISDRVISVLSGLLEVPVDQISEATSTIEDLQIDSLDAVSLQMEIEDAFNITIHDNSFDEVKTVGDIVRIVESKVGIS
jgi:acyl carrier protein